MSTQTKTIGRAVGVLYILGTVFGILGEGCWRRAFDLDFPVDEGVIGPEDRELFWYAETVEETRRGLLDWHEANGPPPRRDLNAHVDVGSKGTWQCKSPFTEPTAR